MQALGCETIDQFVQRAKLKIGDKLTDGVRIWTIKSYKDHAFRHRTGAVSKYYFLEPDRYATSDHGTPGVTTITGLSCQICVIPNLRTAPIIVRTYRYLVQLGDDGAPRVSVDFFPNEEAMRKEISRKEIVPIIWVQRLDKCFKDVEAECPCDEGNDDGEDIL